MDGKIMHYISFLENDMGINVLTIGNSPRHISVIVVFFVQLKVPLAPKWCG